jgi:hypothetical protein
MPKKPIDEEAHFRIDEQERKLAAMPTMDGISSMVTGMLAMCLEEIKREIGKGVSATRADASADKELTGAVRELIDVLKAPKAARTITAHLPSGPVKVTTEVH